MGMDISIWTDKGDEILRDNHPESFLSRTFAGLMMNGDLEDIAKRASVDATAITEMWEYNMDFDWIDTKYGFSKSEKEEMLQKAKKDNERCNGNIDRVIKTIDALINGVAKLKNLSDVIHIYKEKHHRKDINQFYKESNEFYFSDFHLDKDDHNFGYNFGFDLRISQRFVAYAKEKGATMVYFIYM